MERTKSIWTAVLLLGFTAPILSGARGCTVFCDSRDGTVLAGRNWDMWDDGTQTVMWFVPAGNAVHGRICFGRHDDTEDGMNDQGLFMAIAAAPPSGSFWSSHATVFSSQALGGVLAHCASVEEAIAWLKKSPNILINGSARATSGFFGIYGKPRYNNSGVGGHYLIADKSGNSVVCEWVKGELKVIRKSARCQLMTNFLLSNPDMGNYPCPRLATLSSYFEKSGTPTVEAATRALQLASTGITRYSQVYDLAKGEVYLFFGHGFTNPMKFNLVAELAKGPREVELKELFRDQPEFLTFSRPKVTQPSALSADDVLSKAMEARGGVDALRRIRSIHAKGNTILSFGWVDASPTEFFAHRPDRWRWVCDQKSLLGLNLGKLDTGFDGRKGWDCELGAAPKKLKGRVLQQNRETGEFFAWLADPAYYKSMQCLGEASFDGQTCYALKMVPKSGHEETHYYDKTRFLLAGLIHIVDTEGGATLQKETYSEYRAVGGFQFPARQSWQNKWWQGITQYSSIEVNCVEESALMMPGLPAR